MKLVVDKESLVSVADAIREKGGTTESLEFPQGFVEAVGAIESGGGGTEESVGTFFSNFDSNGYPTKLVIKGLKTIPESYIRAYSSYQAITSKVYNIDFGIVETIGVSSFRNCFSDANEKDRVLRFPATVKTIGANAFSEPRSPHIYFEGTPVSIDATALATKRATDIYVPWAEGEVANAPWGATNATIHYNTTYDENGNPIEAEV